MLNIALDEYSVKRPYYFLHENQYTTLRAERNVHHYEKTHAYLKNLK